MTRTPKEMTMPSLMTKLPEVTADPLLSLMAAVNADQRTNKVDLGVGIYKDENGQTPILEAVKAAEEIRLGRETTKSYEGPNGNPEFCTHVETLLLGNPSDRRVVFATPGGSGALFVAMNLAKRISPEGRMFISDPCWPNHLGIAHAVGVEVVNYSYASNDDGTPDYDQMEASLGDLRQGDIVLLQGPCHNPTGTDLNAEQWKALAEFVIKRGALPLIDIAYHGFAHGLEADAASLRAFVQAVPEAILTYSCSKNFGLYRERTGAIIVQSETADLAVRVRMHMSSIVRTAYSMPPAHGPALVGIILGDPTLTELWRQQLDQMRGRVNQIREGFARELVAATNDDRFARLADQRGMFSVLPLKADSAPILREEHAIYLPNSGRINVAGLPIDRLGEVARTIAPYLDR